MNYLSVEQLSKRFGDLEILKELSFGMAKGEKLALIAKNGTGKSTLLNMIAGLDTPDTGQVVWRKDINVQFLSQDPNFDPELSIWDAVFQSDNPILKAIREYEDCIEHAIEGERFQNALDKIEELEAWDHEVRVKSILSELKVDNFDTQIKSLSGGQVKRLALAKVLIDQPDFLILDEPTNHLDLEMIEWLEKFLVSEKLTLLMVTHDRYFLENVCNVILEMDDRGLYTYKGNYSYFLEKREERKQIEQSGIEKAKNLYRKELDWMRRQPKARSTKSKARIDSFYGVEEQAKKRTDEKEVELEFNMERLGSKILEFHNISKSFGDKVLFHGFSYKFQRGEKIGIIGPNGAGKSSFLNLVTENLEPSTGKVIIGETVCIGYYRQDGLDFKSGDRVIEVVKKVAEYLPLMKGKKLSASQLLERFLFPKNMHFNHVSKLSGGEKRRLHLLKILMKNPNVLILDEPTNDLDIMTLQVLENFLSDFPGCVIIVSHDRYFMDKLVDHLFVIEGGIEIKDFPGNYSRYREWKKLNTDKLPEKKTVNIEKPKADCIGKMGFNEKREFGILEVELEKLEKRKAEINSEFEVGIEDNDKMVKLSDELGKVIAELDKKSDRWLILSELGS
jgi:ATP-binding cassette subfamily F protein uup|tara:strand:+ start:168 stop:2024 length:1857 start_codon:yes stop_codon:yes gene_type:complete